MEATGVYRKPVFYTLEDPVECWLLNFPAQLATPEEGMRGLGAAVDAVGASLSPT
jgi:hypothetical protein